MVQPCRLSHVDPALAGQVLQLETAMQHHGPLSMPFTISVCSTAGKSGLVDHMPRTALHMSAGTLLSIQFDETFTMLASNLTAGTGMAGPQAVVYPAGHQHLQVCGTKLVPGSSHAICT